MRVGIIGAQWRMSRHIKRGKILLVLQQNPIIIILFSFAVPHAISRAVLFIQSTRVCVPPRQVFSLHGSINNMRDVQPRYIDVVRVCGRHSVS